MSDADLRRGVLLGWEVELAISLVRAGLRAVQEATLAADASFHFPMLLLASGLERLLKTVLCFAVLADEGRYPNAGEVPTTHDLSQLLDAVIGTSFDDAYLGRPVAQEDASFLRGDPRLRQLVRALSEFGDKSRYYNLDVVTGRTPPYRPPDEVWGEIETEILEEDPFWVVEFLTPEGLDEHSARIAQAFVVMIERLVRALARLLTLSRLSEIGIIHTSRFASFLALTDEQLGCSVY